MASSSDSRSGPVLSVVVPTYNERESIASLISAVLDVAGPTATEVVVVDDASPDGTADVVQSLSATHPGVRLHSRPGKMGLSGAVFAGIEMARGEYVCIMDADLSHDPEEIPEMLALAQSGCDIVVGSRFAPGGSLGGQPLTRRVVSIAANLFARAALGLRTRDVLTGYVLCRREAIAQMPTRYSAGGFKFLLELLSTRRDLRVCEWPIVFQDRATGRSKASMSEGLDLARLCALLLVRRLSQAVGRR